MQVERAAQDEKWNEQNHPDGTGTEGYKAQAEYSRIQCENKAKAGALTWAAILREEFYEALAESDPEALRAELIQVAAVAAAWVEAIDRR